MRIVVFTLLLAFAASKGVSAFIFPDDELYSEPSNQQNSNFHKSQQPSTIEPINFDPLARRPSYLRDWNRRQIQQQNNGFKVKQQPSTDFIFPDDKRYFEPSNQQNSDFHASQQPSTVKPFYYPPHPKLEAPMPSFLSEWARRYGGFKKTNNQLSGLRN